MPSFHKLKVAVKEQLTPNAVALSFEVPDQMKEEFDFKAGQYITIKKEIDGEEVRRAYSISSAPNSGKLTVGIKKVADGTFSKHANEAIAVGDMLDIQSPEGRFVFQPSGATETIAAFAAGSGITPIMSIAHEVLASNDSNRFVLIYGNQSIEETMYRKELLNLKEKYNDRFFVQWVFSRASEADALFGRIERSTVNLLVKNRFEGTTFDRFYLCGPEAMINTVSDTLNELGIAKDKILFELFTAPAAGEDTMAEQLEGKTQVTVILDDEEHQLVMDQKELVLDAVLKENIDAPYSCQGGVCSSCIARVVEGKAEMVKNQILTDGEVAEGLILTCQSHALTPNLKVDYDDV